uniref:Enoyl-CoA hydratase/isomerase family protein n=1 Tax=Coccidioides posadasii RMSCC 3488 TaxID=454284 RepID=A0A0J6FHT9_COCPO|nr:enoyl-CoA hydratase/isomerase family protein [Coccidioides posadasii RMSCC 3488]
MTGHGSASYNPKHFNVTFPREYIAHVETNRADKLNAYFEDMWIELRQVFDQLSVDPNVRAVVFSGAGPRAFSAGLDVKAAAKGVLGGKGEAEIPDPGRAAAQLRRHVASFQDCITAIEKCEKPVICVMHGINYGLAIDISSTADVRICSRDSQIEEAMRVGTGDEGVLNWSRDHTIQDGLRYTGVWNSAALQSADVPTALLSGLQKRKPTFEKL